MRQELFCTNDHNRLMVYREDDNSYLQFAHIRESERSILLDSETLTRLSNLILGYFNAVKNRANVNDQVNRRFTDSIEFPEYYNLVIWYNVYSHQSTIINIFMEDEDCGGREAWLNYDEVVELYNVLSNLA